MCSDICLCKADGLLSCMRSKTVPKPQAKEKHDPRHKCLQAIIEKPDFLCKNIQTCVNREGYDRM